MSLTIVFNVSVGAWVQALGHFIGKWNQILFQSLHSTTIVRIVNKGFTKIKRRKSKRDTQFLYEVQQLLSI